MANTFDPYHVWLGIAPDEQPANHYRLLGIRVFEAKADVIDSAADRQMAHLRTFQAGKNGDLTQRLLNEVAAARVCLLDAKKRTAYDKQLRTKIAADGAVAAIQPAAAVAAARTPVAAQAASPHAAAPATGNKWEDLLGEAATPGIKTAKSVQKTGGKSTALKAAMAKRDAKNRMISLGIAAAIVLLAGAAFGIYSLMSNANGTLVFAWPAAKGADVAVAVDNVQMAPAAGGSWQQDYPPGKHHLVAQRPGYKFETDVDLGPGQQLKVVPDWKAKALLVLNWPVDERAGAMLKLDGRPREISAHDPLELAVDPGQHRIEVVRPGTDQFVATAVVASGQRQDMLVTRPLKDAKLVLDWPLNQRRDAELTIDGQSTVGGSAQPLELTMKPGRHAIRISRPDYIAFSQEVDLAEGASSVLKPNLAPEQKTAIVAAPVSTAPQGPAKKKPIPADAERAAVAKQLDELYKTSGAGAKDAAKAQELYDVAAKGGATPVERYVLLRKGAEIAAAAGDLNLALQGIDALSADYEFEPLEVKQKLLEKIVAVGKPEQVEPVVAVAEQLMEQAIAADRYDLALVLGTTAERAAVKSQIPARKEAEERLSRRRHDIRIIASIYTAAQKAQAAHEQNPSDPDANLTLGRWRCLYKADWAGGLPLLAKGSDEKLKSLAEQELKAQQPKKSPTAEQQVALADAWWDLSQKDAGAARESLRLHAAEIYQAAMPNLASALKKAAIEKRLAEVANLPRPSVADQHPPEIAAETKPPGTKSPTVPQFEVGKWVDILQLVDLAQDRVEGTWARAGAAISTAPSACCRIVVPVVADGSYDLEIEFTRITGSGDIAAVLVVGSHPCVLALSAYGGETSGLMTINGHDARDPANPTSIKPGSLDNGHRYRLTIHVRVDGGDKGSVEALLDGKPYLHWEGDPAVLDNHWAWKLPDSKHLGIGADNNVATFHSVQFRMISGTATADGAAPATVDAQSASPADLEKPSSSGSLPRDRWVDVLGLVDPARDRVNGDWARKGDQLSCTSKEDSRIAIPVVINGGYDFEVEFTRTLGTGDAVALLSANAHGCSASLGAWSGELSGLMMVDGHDANNSNNPIVVRPGTLENGHRYRLLVRTRLLADHRASIDVSLDGRPYFPHWEGDDASLSYQRDWVMPDSKRLGLGAYLSEITFHSARLKMVSGDAALDPAAMQSSGK
ncbi:MAG TPA: hypothetical protein VHX65_00605 [Pirellulales bacterium]|nr:hypothetical protein [Pirellulales bacterium]